MIDLERDESGWLTVVQAELVFINTKGVIEWPNKARADQVAIPATNDRPISAGE